MLTIDEIKKTIEKIAAEYHLTKVTLFGSRANGTAREDSDVDLLVEFSEDVTVTLLTISSLKIQLEEIWNLNVDVVHAPIPQTSILIIDKEIELYAA